MDLLADEKWAQARDSVIRSGDPTLARLYEWMLYREEDISGLPFERVSAFIRNYPEWPEQTKLRATAERVMPYDYPAPSVIAWFTTYPPVTGKGMLQLMTATGTTSAVTKSILVPSWPQAKADSQEQASILSQIGRDIPLSVHEARIDRLLKNEQYTLARSLASFLGRGYPELVEARIALMEEKPGASSLVMRVPAQLYSNTGFMLDRIRWRRERDDNDGAIALLNEVSSTAAGNVTFPEDWWKERNILARRMIESSNYRRAYQLTAFHSLKEGPDFAEAEWLSGWVALRFLNQPDTALQHFIRMHGNVATAISKARAAYWAGRASEASLTQGASAATWYNLAATFPHTYYGQIALRHAHLPYPPLGPPYISQQDRGLIASNPLLQAAIHLQGSDYDKIASMFLTASFNRMTTRGEYAAFAEALVARHQLSAAYRTAKNASWKNIWLGQYYTPTLESQMKRVSTDRALLHSIIRQESQFDPQAISPSGALGLTQLMPATAKEVAQKNGMPYNKDWLLNRPSYNIEIGGNYIDWLLNRYNGAYPLAIAAYNAGPGRVNDWLDQFGDPREGKIDWLDWIEMIPVAETRNYVQRVTEGVVVYREYVGMK